MANEIYIADKVTLDSVKSDTSILKADTSTIKTDTSTLKANIGTVGTNVLNNGSAIAGVKTDTDDLQASATTIKANVATLLSNALSIINGEATLATSVANVLSNVGTVNGNVVANGTNISSVKSDTALILTRVPSIDITKSTINKVSSFNIHCSTSGVWVNAINISGKGCAKKILTIPTSSSGSIRVTVDGVVTYLSRDTGVTSVIGLIEAGLIVPTGSNGAYPGSYFAGIIRTLAIGGTTTYPNASAQAGILLLSHPIYFNNNLVVDVVQTGVGDHVFEIDYSVI
ncbi:hypothetical protein [Clostridium estertheticum]|uniref:hypothetical protein n=1 Tax=Clostridium estertheticum TaxID=238834 RepID=UPI001C0ABB36|nr:hypothetical protein [Clostridium estertheticum]MBU3172770.1 hypothetical protein [Clostridium estertheticum]